ncbi:MAG: hypothetical protein A2W93_04165 [Bacteroidetes bacterium GWF2_43_63]|nr:MAG: hypothetical protein A2W94_06050 [Bacteroidetes bacterium GWE2_42_42]OFY54377.1 MAG: hypothetical protein A2W93_04165 [Bacteroidetes bacterium GWF2_43_63]HBG69233.1 hypothetical protein [Bacteroidales bacterium]HCB61211.1 hypothetical protein [Bacteroidales bacterium]HCY24131.1 hypothetical protein [Bacteroidales bacterium]
MISVVVAVAQPVGDDQQVKTEADLLFSQQKYGEAFPLYSQLLSIHRKDAYYSYRFGVCLLYTDRRDPEAPMKYMEPSVGELSGEDAYMIYFHLGVAYHQAYRFGEALRAFEAFKGKVPAKSPYAKEALIRNQMCSNGISLLQNLSDLSVMKKYEVGTESFFRSYDISKFGGRIGPKPDFLKTKPDRQSSDPELIFISDTHNVVYYSSYGKKNATGRDIYRVYKLPDGKFSTPEKLSDAVNTPYDENYPYLLPDGRTLYFSSKGHNSMGGYDIFRTEFDTINKEWSVPVNVDFAINTPFDDILFITDPSQRYAWFSSLRNSSDGRILVFLVRIDRKIPVYDNYNPELIAGGNIDINSPEYLETIAKLREKASLDVNSNEEIAIDTTKIIASGNNAKYNIPANPTGDQIVDIAFNHVASAEDQLDNFRNMRDASLKISEQKKDLAAALNKQSLDLHEKAVGETDAKKRKDLMAQANDLSKKSLLLTDESDLAKQMYNQYVSAADEQAKNFDQIQDKAGNVQKLALSRQIDNSVVLLKELIDGIDTFKVNLVQLDKKIRGDSEYVSALEKNIADDLSEAANLESQALKLDKEASQYKNEAALATDQEMKDEYLSEANNLLKEAADNREKAQQLKNDARQQQTELVELKSKSDKRDDLVADAIAYVDSLQKASNNNQVVADNNNQIASDTINQNLVNNNNQNNVDNNQNNNNIIIADTNNQDSTDNIQIIADNNAVLNNNNQDVTNNNQIIANNNQNANNIVVDTVNAQNSDNQSEKVAIQISQEITAAADSVEKLIEHNNRESDAISLAFAKKKSDYDFKLSEWVKLRDLPNLSQSQVVKKSELEADLTELNLQMNVLSDYHDELDKHNAPLMQAGSDFDKLMQDLSEKSTADTNELKTLQARSKAIIDAMQPATDDSEQILAINTTEIKSEISKIEKDRNALQPELNDIEKKIQILNEKLENTDNPKKRTQIETDIAVNKEKADALKERLSELNEMIIALNDSIGYLERHHQLLGEVRSSYLQIPDSELKTMSEKWNSTVLKPDVKNVEMLPDFNAYDQQNIPADTTQNITDNNQNIADNNNQVVQDNNNQNVQDNNNLTEKVAVSDEEQDLIQSSFYESGAQTFMVRIASLKKKLATNPADSNQIKNEIAVLTKTMQAYNNEADAYENNAENNLKLVGKQLPEKIPEYSEKSMIDFHEQLSDVEMQKADSVQRLADASTDAVVKNKLQKQADDFKESAKRHYLMASDIYGIWNNSEFESNNIAFTESNVNRTQDTDNARMLMIEARQLRSEAYGESDFAKQREILAQAQKKEAAAIDSQEKSMEQNSIENPEKIVSKTIAEIESTTGNDIAEITKQYPSNTALLAAYEKSQQTSDSIIEDNNQITANSNITNQNNNQVVDNNVTNVNTQVSENNNQITDNAANNNQAENIVVANNQVTNERVADNKLYYRIQISASRVEIDTTKYFQGMNVVVDKTGGWNQYMTGYFTSYNPALTELRRVQPMGYADAFIVAYYDGKRVPVYEARRMEQGGTPANVAQTASTGNFSMNDVEGLVYSVQVGVYAKTRNSTSLFGISPLIEERMNNGYYRYYAGTFNNMNDAVTARNKIRTSGVPDAFVVILYKGKKITQAEAAQLQTDGTTFGGGLKQSGAGTQPQNTQVTPTNITPASKPVFKVQIGAYSKDVPVNVVNELIALAGQGIETTKNDAGLTVYTVGNFSKYTEAEAKKNELNAKGLSDAFVVAYIDGKRVSVSEARKIGD